MGLFRYSATGLWGTPVRFGFVSFPLTFCVAEKTYGCIYVVYCMINSVVNDLMGLGEKPDGIGEKNPNS